MGMGEAVKSVFSQYATFSGRARRAEYWWFTLFNVIVSIVISVVELSLSDGSAEFGGPLSLIYSLAVLLPGVAVGVRRLHDVGRSGWWTFILLIPLVGVIMFIYWTTKLGDDGSNFYGPDPLSGQRNTLTGIPHVPRA